MSNVGLVLVRFLDQEYWRRVGRQEIETALRRPVNWNPARNVIILVGDGMDPNTITASRIYKEKEEGKLSFERFPHLGLLKVNSDAYWLYLERGPELIFLKFSFLYALI